MHCVLALSIFAIRFVMGLPPSNIPRAHLGVAIGILVALVVVLLPRPERSAASDVARWRTALAADTHDLASAQADRVSAKAQLVAVRREHDRLLLNVSDRLVSIYKSGGARGVGNVVSNVAQSRSHSVSDATAVADALTTVAHNDRRSLRRYRALSRRVEVLDQRIADLGSRIRTLTTQVASDRAKLVAAQKAAAAAAAAAKARAAELARQAEVPLTPRAVSAASVTRATAEAAPVPSAAPTPAPAPAPPASAGITETGIASMYSDEFTGDPTASGEPYDPNAMTAAHRTLPLGTWVTVTGPGGSALVRINDRGPFVGGRIIDLSRAAANAVGLGGLAQVTISVQS